MKNLFKNLINSIKSKFNLIFKISIIGMFLFFTMFLLVEIIPKLSLKKIHTEYSNKGFSSSSDDEGMKLELKIMDDWNFEDYFIDNSWYVMSGKLTIKPLSIKYEEFSKVKSGSEIELLFVDTDSFETDRYLIEVDVSESKIDYKSKLLNEITSELDPTLVLFFKRRFDIEMLNKSSDFLYRIK
tara:strand:+ start:81 stop:632 length:552 start_codon:yes stop_codon:yes gene_type:complete